VRKVPSVFISKSRPGSHVSAATVLLMLPDSEVVVAQITA
jgi:hypothetical protein